MKTHRAFEGIEPQTGLGPRVRDWSLLTTAASMIALAAAISLQFLSYIDPLLGRSATAISGASIIATSIVFACIITVFSYVHGKQVGQSTALLETVSETAAMIAAGRNVSAHISQLGEKLAARGVSSSA